MRDKIGKHLKIILVSMIFVLIVSVCIDGLWLFGIPDAEDVQSVQVTNLRYSTEPKTFSDAENIQLAVQLSGFLKYKLFSDVQSDSEPIVTITYHLSNGSSQSLSANEDTLWWKGKTRSLKQENIFLKLSEGIFFYEEAIAAE